MFAKDEVVFHLDALGAGVFVFLEQSLQNLDLCHGSLIIFPVTRTETYWVKPREFHPNSSNSFVFSVLSLFKIKQYLVNQIQLRIPFKLWNVIDLHSAQYFNCNHLIGLVVPTF